MKYQPKALALLNAADLKYLAAALMLIDHFGMIFFPQLRALRMIGRLSMPIWAFFIAQGALKTHSPGKYALRLAIFALVSEPCYDLARFGQLWETSMQNVGITLLLGLLTCYFATWMQKGEIPVAGLPAWLAKSAFTPVLCILLTAGVIVLSMFTRSDYGVFGVLAILMFYLFGDNLIGLFFSCAVPNFIHWYSLLGSSLNFSSFSALLTFLRRYSMQISTQWMAVFAFIPWRCTTARAGRRRNGFSMFFIRTSAFVRLMHLLLIAL
jgi:hypothetical protein